MLSRNGATVTDTCHYIFDYPISPEQHPITVTESIQEAEKSKNNIHFAIPQSKNGHSHQ